MNWHTDIYAVRNTANLDTPYSFHCLVHRRVCWSSDCPNHGVEVAQVAPQAETCDVVVELLNGYEVMENEHTRAWADKHGLEVEGDGFWCWTVDGGGAYLAALPWPMVQTPKGWVEMDTDGARAHAALQCEETAYDLGMTDKQIHQWPWAVEIPCSTSKGAAILDGVCDCSICQEYAKR